MLFVADIDGQSHVHRREDDDVLERYQQEGGHGVRISSARVYDQELTTETVLAPLIFPCRILGPRPRPHPVAVAALLETHIAGGHLDDPIGDPIQEVAVVGDGDEGSPEALELRFERLDGVDVEVVRRLVQDEQGSPRRA